MAELGICKIKPGFILPEQKRTVDLAFVSDKDKSELDAQNSELEPQNSKLAESTENSEPLSKRPKLLSNKKLKGQNKNRHLPYRPNRKIELCNFLYNVVDGEEIPKCQRKKCENLHDIDEYLKIKPKDIGETCNNFRMCGNCCAGIGCRFGGEHISKSGRNIVDQPKFTQWQSDTPQVRNHLSQELQVLLRKKKYNFELAEKLVLAEKSAQANIKKETDDNTDDRPHTTTFGTVTDEDIIKLKTQERKKIDWTDKLYLSPLTTVGNLPFRRICKEYGADITCGEMAMCQHLLQGGLPEWALVKRHPTEDIFGVQLCANNPFILTKCGQLLQNECDIDFIDLNLGCPLDFVYRQGAGSGLLRRVNSLGSCVKNLSNLLSIPMTVKTRTGVYTNENIAHELAPKFREWGASLITVHGRSREQRYTKSADWKYIRQVAQAAAPLPVFGNGDILSYEDYKNFRDLAPELQGAMIGRGALIKPWIFTEIKERKIWDISSNERFDLIKKYVNYGLEHWGSDNKGVENTRRFLLEWLSFLYRYVPVGILEHPPQKINDRPPFYRGRNELETLMASPSASDWIKISEMFLGPIPDGFHFLPKHKANSYSVSSSEN